MQKLLMASVAAIGLTTAGLAFAQETQPTVDPAAPAAQQPMETMPQAPVGTDPAATTTMPSSDSAATEMENSTAGTAASQFGSYRNTEPGSFSGTIAGNFSADELMDRDIVDGEGNSVGEVSDLLIGSDGSIQNVLVDVGGFLGLGQRTVALDLNQLQMAQGDAGEELVVNMSKEQIENLPPVEQNESGWGMGGAMGAGEVPPSATTTNQ
jgi:sporulation protein YlmC with PRC-barrel domain